MFNIHKSLDKNKNVQIKKKRMVKLQHKLVVQESITNDKDKITLKNFSCQVGEKPKEFMHKKLQTCELRVKTRPERKIP